MDGLTIKEIGVKLKQAGRLETNPLCIYGSESIPEKGVPIKALNRFIANAIFNLSIREDIHAIYIGNNVLEGCVQEDKHGLDINPLFPS